MTEKVREIIREYIRSYIMRQAQSPPGSGDNFYYKGIVEGLKMSLRIDVNMIGVDSGETNS